MILADKIIRLRKKNGWSQEELAEKMNVSRQAVSKWEGAQTIPDLEKILMLGNLFGVTTDYLLKDEIEDEEVAEEKSNTPIKRVSMETANEFLEWRKKAAARIATGVFLCILSPITLFILMAATTVPTFGVTENVAAALGLSILLIIVAVAVMLFVLCDLKNAPFKFIEKEPFETDYGVTGMVKEKQKEYKNTYALYSVIGIFLCVISPIPLFMGAFAKNGFLMMIMLTVTMAVVGIGVLLLVIANIRWASMQKLLKEGEFSQNKKTSEKLNSAVQSVYWLVVTAAYLGWSFVTNDWHITWIIWPVAAVLSGIIEVVCNFVGEKDK